jgi:D-inositol-3-phosphate glycosyltransferase
VKTRIATLMVHTSPLEQAGIGDAGGMNIYVLESSIKMAEAGAIVDIYTRATSPMHKDPVTLAPNVTLRYLDIKSGDKPCHLISKEELPSYIPELAEAFSRQVEALAKSHGVSSSYYDLIHSHYWISGMVAIPAADKFALPLVHTMHTMAKVKNLSLAEGENPEPQIRLDGEDAVVRRADALIANTGAEASSLVSLYGARQESVHVVAPGVDLARFTPQVNGKVGKEFSRNKLGFNNSDLYLTFVGRIQPHKGPDVLVKALAEMLKHTPTFKSKIHLQIVGGASGNGSAEPERLKALAQFLGVNENVNFYPPVDRSDLPDWYRASDIVCVPSYSESFGLVALEAQACGTPVVATAVGGLRTAVSDGISGSLVDGHDPRSWAATLTRLLLEPQRRLDFSFGAIEHANHFGWARTARGILGIYDDLIVANSDAKPRLA